MIKSLKRRAFLLVVVSALVGAALPSFHQQSTALADWEYMCDSWEQSCDDGSGGGPGGGNGGGGSGGWMCPTNNNTCGTLVGCHPRTTTDPTQVCSRYNLEGQTGCTSPVNCTHN